MPGRILHIIDSLHRGGTASQLLLLCEALAREGWDVHVAALRAAALRESSPARRLRTVRNDLEAVGVHVVELGRRFAIDPLADVALARHVAWLQPDVVQTWDTLPGLFGPMVNKKNGRPRIIAGEYHARSTTTALEWRIYRRFAPHVDRFVTNSPVVRDWLIDHGLPAEKFVVIPSGVRTGSAESAGLGAGGWGLAVGKGVGGRGKGELLHELELPADARLIGVVGALDLEHGVKRLIWAADLLRVLHDNLRILIVGDGRLRNSLVRYARLTGDLDHIRFLGERDDVWRIMPYLDVLWNGSENSGPSMSILEAMAAGIPVVASDTPANRELVIGNETGYLVPLHVRSGRAVRARQTDRIFREAEMAQRLSERARARIQQVFCAEMFIRTYSELLSRMF